MNFFNSTTAQGSAFGSSSNQQDDAQQTTNSSDQNDDQFAGKNMAPPPVEPTSDDLSHAPKNLSFDHHTKDDAFGDPFEIGTLGPNTSASNKPFTPRNDTGFKTPVVKTDDFTVESIEKPEVKSSFGDTNPDDLEPINNSDRDLKIEPIEEKETPIALESKPDESNPEDRLAEARKKIRQEISERQSRLNEIDRLAKKLADIKDQENQIFSEIEKVAA